MAPPPHQHVVLSVFLLVIILAGMEWYFFVVSISLTTDDVHALMWLFVIFY